MNRAQQIIKDYEQIRNKSKRDLEQRKVKLYEKLPRLENIEKEMIKLGIDISRAILNNSHNKGALLDELQKHQLDLKIEKAEMLASNKYSLDYLDLKYQCTLCKDTGVVNNSKCRCYLQKEIDYSYKQSNLYESFNKENFDQFRFDYYSSSKDENGVSPRLNMEKVFRNCIDYVNKFNTHNKNLLFIGKPGLGKTFLCKSIAKDLIEANKNVIYQHCPDLIDMVRKYKFDFNNEEQSSQYLSDVYNCDLLIIDDLGTELTTQFTGLAIYNILNRRISNNKKLVIATNLDVDEIVKIYSDRITSRLFGNFDVFEFFGEDIRLKMHKII